VGVDFVLAPEAVGGEGARAIAAWLEGLRADPAARARLADTL